MKGNSKEQIKNRMIETAATLWGVTANEIEMSFDPIVTMLISSCALEIEKISGEIDQSQVRITEKLIQLMTQETIYGPKPAYAILHTEPIEDRTTINPDSLFYYKKEVAFRNTSVNFKNIYFSPIQEFKLIQANVKYIVSGNTFVELTDNKNRQTIFEKNSLSALPDSTLYLGISSSLPFLTLENISFYFELIDIENKKSFYHHLRNATWELESSKINVIEGLQDEEELRIRKLDSIFEEISNKSTNITDQTRRFYNKNYITIKSVSKNKKIIESTFDELNNVIQENKIKLESGIRWIKIKFPRVISNNQLKNVTVP